MVQRGVEMAIAEINAGGGAGRRMKMVAARADLPWEGGARELVRAVYNDDAWAVVGGLDDHSARVAQQVVTRARGRTVLLTPWAADPSLAQVRIPWFFRLVPDDRAQAAALAGALFAGNAGRHVALLVRDSAAERRAAEAFRRAAPAGAVLLLGVGGDGKPDGGALAARLRRSAVDAVGLYLEPAAAAGVARQLRTAGLLLPLFGPLELAQKEFVARAGQAAEGMVVAAPETTDSHPGAREFSRRFTSRYGEEPAPVALYARDAVYSLAAALRRCEGRRSELASALSSTAIEGVTGKVIFSAGGERLGGVAPARIGGIEGGEGPKREEMGRWR
jgi:branched-chain amino acid transport system substrate-binding protein